MPGPAAHWKHEPEEHDFPAAAEFLALVLPNKDVERVIRKLHDAPTVVKRGRDILRASRLPLLARDDMHVASDLAKVARGELLSPVLLVRGKLAKGVPLIIADGYHRICASHHLDPDADVPCRIVGS